MSLHSPGYAVDTIGAGNESKCACFQAFEFCLHFLAAAYNNIIIYQKISECSLMVATISGLAYTARLIYAPCRLSIVSIIGAYNRNNR